MKTGFWRKPGFLFCLAPDDFSAYCLRRAAPCAGHKKHSRPIWGLAGSVVYSGDAVQGELAAMLTPAWHQVV